MIDEDSEPLVSVLMPAFNASKFIVKAINSILEQTHTNWELLILDDASTDNTLEIILSFLDPRIRVFKHTENQGYLKSCNELFEIAKGDFVTFLDADDTCSNERLKKCLFQFRKDPKLDFLTTNHYKTDAAGQVISEHQVSVDYSKYSTDSEYYPTICCATIFLQRNLLKKAGSYHPFFDGIGGEDYHWLFRLSLAGKGFHLKEKYYLYRTHENQIQAKNKNALKYFSKDIDQEIRNTFIKTEKDLLLDRNNLESKWQTYIDEHPGELIFRKAGLLLNRNKKNECLEMAFYIIKTTPINTTSWRRFIYLVYSIVRR